MEARELHVTPETLALLERRSQERLSELAPTEQRVHYLAAGSRTRRYKPLEPARMIPPRWTLYPVSNVGKCHGCNKELSGEPYIELPAFAPGQATPSILARFCGDLCLVRYAHSDSDLDRVARLKELDKQEEAALSEVRQRFAKAKAESALPLIVFCYICRSAMVVGDRERSELRRCEACETAGRSANIDRFCHTCGKPFVVSKAIKGSRPINCPDHLSSQPAAERTKELRTKGGLMAAVKRTKSGYTGRVADLGGKFRWNEEGKVLDDHEKYDLILPA